MFVLSTSTSEITVRPGASVDYKTSKSSYWIKVMVTDGEDDSGVAQSEPAPDATVPVIIRILNVNEPGRVTLSTSTPRVGVQLSATLSDPDGVKGGIFRSWWSRANSADGLFYHSADEFNKNNRNRYYTPGEADQYKYLKFTAEYFDGHCPRLYRYSHTQQCLRRVEVVSESPVADQEGLIIQQQVTNVPATGWVRIEIYSYLQVGHALWATPLNIRDANGTEGLYDRRSRQNRLRYQWFRIDPVTGAEAKVHNPERGVPGYSYVITEADRGKGLQARVSFQDDYGHTETLRSATQMIPAPPNNVANGSPVITGIARVGETLSADLSGISDADSIATSTLTYVWFANDSATDTAIEGATSSTYTLEPDDEGKAIMVQVIFTDGYGYNEVLTSAPTATVTGGTNNVGSNDAATGAPTITGTAQVGQTLTATTTDISDADGLTNNTYSYQWIRHDLASSTDEDIAGATGSTYTVSAEDEGKGIKVQVSFTDDAGNAESLTSSATSAAAPPNSPATGLPGIIGFPQVGQTLTATTTDISDADGLTNNTYSYQWIRHDLASSTDEDIAGATGSTYTVSAEDEGKGIKVRVSFTDDAGNEESLTSNTVVFFSLVFFQDNDDARNEVEEEEPTLPSSQQVSQENSPATGAPTIMGTAQVGQTLTATTTDISDADGLTSATYNYQWLADDTEISGETGSNYTLVAADRGKVIKVRASFTDDTGNSESLTSAATAAITTLLTAAASNAPASHDGSSAFTFDLRFSDSPKRDFSYRTLWNHAFTVAGGDVAKTRRMAPHSDTRNIHWEITVRPSSSGAVTVVLPVTTDCSSQGAICAEDGRKLSVPLELVIPGPSSQQISQENSPATGMPTISDTVQVGERLTASTSGISDADGMINANFSYRWLADDTEISGETGSSYTLVAADQGKVIKVRVSFTDDAGNSETLTSAATAAAAPVSGSPVTISLENAANTHDGSTPFTFHLRFSEEFTLSYKTLRDHAFTVTPGTVVNARRLARPSNILWEITIRPGGNGNVVITLPATEDCAANGAICTGDGRKLSSMLELSVSGPGQ